MPFINDKLAETAGDRVPRLNNQGGLSRFRFDPSAVLSLVKKRIVGQPEMKQALDDVLHLVKADFGDPHKPLAVTLFLGPTGVGKTETVRLVAEAIHGDADHFCRIDMNTLSQQHYAAALSGAPPGYVGSKEGHTLLNAELIQGTFSKPGIVLLDEIEKADRDVVRTLLNVLDNGHLRLAGGSGQIDFRNSLIFMTSNIGAGQVVKARTRPFRRMLRQGWKTVSDKKIFKDALHSHFDPEFLNRIDRTVVFDQLDPTQLDALIDAELVKLAGRLAPRKLELRLTPPVRGRIKGGYDSHFGARDLARHFRQWVDLPLAHGLLVHPDATGFVLALEDDKVVAKPG